MVSVCVLCAVETETTPHLFLHCTFTVALWRWPGAYYTVQFDNSSFLSIFGSYNHAWSMQVQQLALATITHVFHTIWMARNVIRFNNASIMLQATKMKIHFTITLDSDLLSLFFDLLFLPFAVQFYLCLLY
ncbi:putative ribonuclease H protein, partial [Trifolium medium]|nr:putative ribonuclease H protein [Trifolium medium]